MPSHDQYRVSCYEGSLGERALAKPSSSKRSEKNTFNPHRSLPYLPVHLYAIKPKLMRPIRMYFALSYDTCYIGISLTLSIFLFV